MRAIRVGDHHARCRGAALPVRMRLALAGTASIASLPRAAGAHDRNALPSGDGERGAVENEMVRRVAKRHVLEADFTTAQLQRRRARLVLRRPMGVMGAWGWRVSDPSGNPASIGMVAMRAPQSALACD